MTLASNINIITALSSEARPLIDRLKLDRVMDARGFQLYTKNDVSLVIAGIGRTRAAAATGWLAARQGDSPSSAWLNVGIAGHGTRAAGSLVMAGKIRDAASDRHVFPPPLVGLGIERDLVVTVDRPELGYAESAAYEMEAFAVWDAATRFVTGELVAFMKIVSDGPEAGEIQSIDRERVLELVTTHVDAVCGVVDELRALSLIEAQRTAAPAGIEAYLERWHFTVSARHELTGLLRGLHARDPGADAIDSTTAAAKNARSALDALAARVQAASSGLARESIR